MKKYLVFLGALAAYGQTVSLSDTLTNAVGGGSFTGRITVTLNAPASAQPLYYSTTSLTGWQAVYCIGVTGADCTSTTSAGTFAATLYANSTITPAGTSYAARFQPTKGSPWSETWVVTPSTTTLRQVRATTVPTPTTTFQPSQIAAGGASNGNCLVFDGSTWAGAACASGGGSGTVTSVAATVPSILSVTGSPITSSGTLAFSLATQTANQVFAGPTTGAAAAPTFRSLVSADIPANAANTSGNAATATALAADPAACPSGEYVSDIAANGTLTCSTPAGGGGSGTVTSVSVTTANGVSGSVATATTTPAITLTLGAITPTSVAASGNVTGANLSGTNTGDQTTITGNAGTATALAANPADCAANNFATTIAANGDLTCAQPSISAGVSGLGTGVATFLGTPSSANLRTALTDETGTGSAVFATSPTLVTPALGTPSALVGTNITGTAAGFTAGAATALAANPADCSAGQYATTIAANGDLTCAQVAYSQISGTPTQVVSLAIYKAAVCQNTTASMGFSTPTTNPAVAACVTGANTQYGQAEFADGANTLSVQDHFTLPSDFTGAIDVSGMWITSATSGAVVWQVATACVADGETGDPAFNTASTVTETAKGTTLQFNAFSMTSITITGCAAGEELYWRFFRDPTNGSDTLAATANLISMTFKYRRTL